MAKYGWLKTGRVHIIDGYCPPLYPKIDFDAGKMVKIIKETHGNVVRMQPLGYYAYYPTEHFPLHPDLGGRDLLKEMINACKPEGIKVIPYIPVGHPFLPFEFDDEKYNSWAALDRQGKRKKGGWHLGYFQYFPLCLNTPYKKVIRSIVKEITANYEVDGIYFDGPYQPNPRWFFGICYCQYCRDAYREATGKEIPIIEKECDWNDANFRQYYDWLMNKVLLGTLVDLIRIIKEIKDIPVLFNNGLWISPTVAMWTGNERYEITDGFLFESADTLLQKMKNIMLARSTGKYVWSYIGGYTVSGRLQHLRSDFGYACKWLSTPVNSEELLMEGYTVTACGGSPAFWATNRFYYDKKGREYLKPSFRFLEENASVLENMSPTKFIGMLISGNTADWYLKERKFNPYYYYHQGGFNLLKEAHHQVVPIYDHGLTLQDLKAYPILFLPNAACMSDGEAKMITDYVSGGGNLIATHETSRYNEKGNIRDNFALAEVFGVKVKDRKVHEYTNLYFKIKYEHPVTKGFDVGDLIPQDPQILKVEAESQEEVLAVTCQIGFDGNLGPAVIARKYGKGKVVYISSGLEAIYSVTRFASLRKIFDNIVKWMAEDKIPYRIQGPTGLATNMMESRDSLLLHLLNNNGGKGKESFCREEYVPVFNIEVEIRLPKDKKVKSVQLLNSEQRVESKIKDEFLRINIERIHIYEVVLIELE